MFEHFNPGVILAALVSGALSQAACAQVPNEAHIDREVRIESPNPNSIQPETTLSISATGTSVREPDLAYINAGVQTDAKTAADALADNAARMNGVFDALKAAGIAERDIQTSSFNLSLNYDYSGEGPPKLIGYNATNQVRAKVTDLENLGQTLDALVSAGGNTLNGIQFGLEDDSAARDEARRKAMTDALARAELYADAAGYRVGRIVSISEGGGNFQPVPRLARAQAELSAAAPTPVASGELTYSASVNVLFELEKN